MTSALPFDDFRTLLRTLPEANRAAAERVRAVFAGTRGPDASLGRLEDTAAWLAEWSGRAPPAVNRPLVAIFAGNHGIAELGVSPRRVEETARAVELCAAGGAAINQVCLAHDLGLKVFDLALHLPTADFTQEPALDERGCAATMAFGMEAVAGGTDLLCIGDLGVGGSTAAAATFCLLYGGIGSDWVGSGSDEAIRSRQAQVIDAAVALHGSTREPLEVLRRVGGREFAAIAGAIVAARTEKVPVILDGDAAIAAAAILHASNPAAVDHCLFGAAPAEPGPRRAAANMGFDPLLDMKLAHEAGVGAALAAGIVKAAALTASGLAAVSPA